MQVKTHHSNEELEQVAAAAKYAAGHLRLRAAILAKRR